jgi:hypothetical protein
VRSKKGLSVQKSPPTQGVFDIINKPRRPLVLCLASGLPNAPAGRTGGRLGVLSGGGRPPSSGRPFRGKGPGAPGGRESRGQRRGGPGRFSELMPVPQLWARPLISKTGSQQGAYNLHQLTGLGPFPAEKRHTRHKIDVHKLLTPSAGCGRGLLKHHQVTKGGPRVCRTAFFV